MLGKWKKVLKDIPKKLYKDENWSFVVFLDEGGGGGGNGGGEGGGELCGGGGGISG